MPGEFDFDMGAAVDEVAGGLGLDLLEGGSGDDSEGLPNLEVTPPAAEEGREPPADPAAGTPPTEPVAPDPAAEPPKTWRKEAAATWAALPAEARAEVLKREEDIFKGIEVYKADAGFGKSMKTALDPYMPVLAQHNIDPVAQVRGLMEAHHTLALGSPEQKAALFQKLAADYKVDLSQLQAPGEAPYLDPAVKSLQAELNAVKSQLTTAEQTRMAEVKQTLTREIEAFAANPANIHFEAVANDMAQLLQSGVCKTLAEAYDKAVWTNPVTRAQEVTRQQTEASKKAAEEAAAKAVAARKSMAANVRTSAKSGGAAAPLGSIDDTLAATLAAIKSRG